MLATVHSRDASTHGVFSISKSRQSSRLELSTRAWPRSAPAASVWASAALSVRAEAAAAAATRIQDCATDEGSDDDDEEKTLMRRGSC